MTAATQEKLTITPEAMESLKKEISEQLQKRGINVEITLGLEYTKHGEPVPTMDSTTFQTFPVLFKEIKLAFFGSWLKEEEDHLRFTATVSARYDHFRTGSNGCDLFTITARIKNDTVYAVTFVN